MSPESFMYDQIYVGVKKKGCTEATAREAAYNGAADYRKGKHDRVVDLISKKIKEAVDK